MIQIENKYKVNKFDIASNYLATDVCDDIITLIDDLVSKSALT